MPDNLNHEEEFRRTLEDEGYTVYFKRKPSIGSGGKVVTIMRPGYNLDSRDYAIIGEMFEMLFDGSYDFSGNSYRVEIEFYSRW